MPIIFEDLFSASSLDTSIWAAVGFSGVADQTNIPRSHSGGALRFSPAANISSASANGITTQTTYDLRSATLDFQLQSVPASGDSNSQLYCIVWLDSQRYFTITYNANNGNGGFELNSTVSGATQGYYFNFFGGSVERRFLRFTHDALADQLVFYSSTSGTAYYEEARFNRPTDLPLTALKVSINVYANSTPATPGAFNVDSISVSAPTALTAQAGTGAGATFTPGQTKTVRVDVPVIPAGQTVSSFAWSVLGTGVAATLAGQAQGANYSTINVTAGTPAGDNGVVRLQCVVTDSASNTATALVDVYVVRVDADDVIQISNSITNYLIGPQLKIKSANTPWAFFDANAEAGSITAARFPFVKPTRNVLAGTVTATNSSTAIVGTGTDFLTSVPPFSQMHIAGDATPYAVASITDDTHLQLAALWGGASVSGATITTAHAAYASDNEFTEGMNYYDLALTMYILFYRTGNPLYSTYARKVADVWWTQTCGSGNAYSNNQIAPRLSSLAGMMLRALDGKPEYCDWIERAVNDMYGVWFTAQQNDSPSLGLIYMRELAYTFLYVTYCSQVLPDTYQSTIGAGTIDGAAKRALYGTRADTIAAWLAARPFPDGSFRERSPGNWVGIGSQPFHEGLVGEALEAYHRVRNDTTTKNLIVNLADAIYTKGYHTQFVEASAGVQFTPQTRWRGYDYALYTPDYGTSHLDLSNPPLPVGAGAPWLQFATQPNGQEIVDARSLAGTSLHLFGYAYHLTGNALWKTRGDDQFAAVFGTAGEVGADSFRGNASDFSAYNYRHSKNYNEHYRAGGRYLAWRTQATLAGDTSAPTISLAASSTSVIAVSSVTLTATASDNVGVVRVEFYEGASILSSDLSAPFTHILNFTSANNGAHTYTAKAFDAAGNFATSAAMVVTVNIPASLSAPMLNAITGIGENSLTLSWNDVVGETGYEIYQKTGTSGSYALIATTPANTISNTVTGLTPSTVYYYKVRAINASGASNFSNITSATTAIVVIIGP